VSVRTSSRGTIPLVEEDTYTPPQAARILKLTRQRITQMLQAGELEGMQDPDTGRWKIPQRAIHARLADRPARPRSEGRGTSQASRQEAPHSPEAASELVEEVRALERALGRLEGRLELTEQAESTLREQLERERERADAERERAESERERGEELARQLEEARKSWWRKLFG
jgi:hypothetical protein